MYQVDRKDSLKISPMIGAFIMDHSDQVRDSTVVTDSVNISPKMALLAINSAAEYKRTMPKPPAKKTNRYLDDGTYAVKSIDRANFTLPGLRKVTRWFKKIYWGSYDNYRNRCGCYHCEPCISTSE